MERPRCKLCSRSFANGRALGGHMKAHLAPLPIPPKPLLHRHVTTNESTSISSASPSAASSSRDSAQEENGDDKPSIHGLVRESPRRSPEFSDPVQLSSLDGAALIFRDEEESEAETTRRSPKRARRRPCEGEEEDVAIAMCLVMLSRDKWTATATAAKSDTKRHRCEVCNKAFRSSQALGGHRVTHRKALDTKEGAKKRRSRLLDGETDNVFECPYCFKVFGSGQALGGHKRSHLIGSRDGSPLSSSKAGNLHEKNSLIDLNLPAPPEEDDDRSVVSDGEITEPAGRTLSLGSGTIV